MCIITQNLVAVKGKMTKRNQFGYKFRRNGIKIHISGDGCNFTGHAVDLEAAGVGLQQPYRRQTHGGGSGGLGTDVALLQTGDGAAYPAQLITGGEEGDQSIGSGQAGAVADACQGIGAGEKDAVDGSQVRQSLTSA